MLCFVLLLVKIPFFSRSFTFVAMSRFYVWNLVGQLVTWNPHTFVYLPIFVSKFLLFFYLILCCELLAAVISLLGSFNVIIKSFCFLYSPQCWHVLFPLLIFIDIAVNVIWMEGLVHSHLISLTFAPFVLILLLSILRMVKSIFQWELPRCLSLWWDSCCRPWFQEVFSFLFSHFFFLFHLFDGACLYNHDYYYSY